MPTEVESPGPENKGVSAQETKPAVKEMVSKEFLATVKKKPHHIPKSLLHNTQRAVFQLAAFKAVQHVMLALQQNLIFGEIKDVHKAKPLYNDAVKGLSSRFSTDS